MSSNLGSRPESLEHIPVMRVLYQSQLCQDASPAWQWHCGPVRPVEG